MNPPLDSPISQDNNIVTKPWGDFAYNLYRFTLPMYSSEVIGGEQLALAAAGNPDKITIDTSSIITYGFDGGVTTEELHGELKLPHSYQEGADITPFVYWYPVDGNAGNVHWQLEYYLAGANGNSTATLTSTSAAGGTAWAKTLASFTAISGTNVLIADLLHFRIFRDPTDVLDTYASDAALGAVGIYFLTNTRGSFQGLQK